jgi:hypothetical protein
MMTEQELDDKLDEYHRKALKVFNQSSLNEYVGELRKARLPGNQWSYLQFSLPKLYTNDDIERDCYEYSLRMTVAGETYGCNYRVSKHNFDGKISRVLEEDIVAKLCHQVGLEAYRVFTIQWEH